LTRYLRKKGGEGLLPGSKAGWALHGNPLIAIVDSSQVKFA
jgi:hypothetical protein